MLVDQTLKFVSLAYSSKLIIHLDERNTHLYLCKFNKNVAWLLTEARIPNSLGLRVGAGRAEQTEVGVNKKSDRSWNVDLELNSFVAPNRAPHSQTLTSHYTREQANVQPVHLHLHRYSHSHQQVEKVSHTQTSEVVLRCVSVKIGAAVAYDLRS